MNYVVDNREYKGEKKCGEKAGNTEPRNDEACKKNKEGVENKGKKSKCQNV